MIGPERPLTFEIPLFVYGDLAEVKITNEFVKHKTYNEFWCDVWLV